MRFSVDQESVADIIASLTSYSDEIDSAFDKFQDEIKIIAIRTNYNKMLIALQNIIDIYNNVICGSMRERLINIWLEEGESLHSFVEDVYMGEESEDAVRRIESNLGDIFSINYNNSLLELEFEGDTRVTKEDFDEAVKCFESFKKEIELISETNSEYFENKIEDNELYRFLIPIIEAISVGIAVFSDSARTNMDRLGDNYIEKMVSLKEKVEEAKSESKPMDFDLDLFDFDDNVSGSLENNSIGTATALPTIETEAKPQPSTGTMNNTKSNSDTKESNKYEDIINALKNFNGNQCAYRELRTAYDKHIAEYRKKLEDLLSIENVNLEKELSDYHKQLELQVKNRHMDLNARYIKGTISLQQAQMLFAESCNRADQLYSTFAYNINIRKKAAVNKANSMLEEEKKRSNSIVQNVLQQRTGCKYLFNNKEALILKLQSGEDCIQEISEYIKRINCAKCTQCMQLSTLSNALQIVIETAQSDLEWFDMPSQISLNDYYSIRREAVKDICKNNNSEDGISKILDQYGLNDQEEQKRIIAFANRIQTYKDRITDEDIAKEYIDKQYCDFNKLGKITPELVDFIASTIPANYDDETRKKIGDEYLESKKKYSSVKCRHYTNYDEIYRRELDNRKDNAEPIAKKIINSLSKNLEVINDSWDKTAHYNPIENGIFYNATEDAANTKGKSVGTTFYHELGHMIDYTLAKNSNLHSKTISADSSFTAALEHDKQRLIKRFSNELEREDIKKELRRNRLLHSVSDIFDGMKIEKEFGEFKWGPFGHTKKMRDANGTELRDERGIVLLDESYWDREYALEKETFAHMYEAAMGNINKQQFMKDLLPETYRTFLNLLNLYGGKYES